MDGKRIVSGSSDGTVRIQCESKCGKRCPDWHPLKGHTDWVKSVGFSPDGKRIVSGSADKTLRVWDVERGVQIGGPLEGHTARVMSVEFSSDGKRIVSGSDDKTVRVWDVHGY
ncbi:WD40-repeat-containing domain protein, partial [Pisolithus tinctorius]